MLNLSGRGIGGTGMKKLTDSCCFARAETVVWRRRPYQSPLVCLWLENNHLYPNSAENLAQLIAVSPSLRHLHLGHNALGNEGVHITSQACLSQVQVCDLTDNQIGPTGASSLAKALKDRSCAVQTLILDSNSLRDEGVMTIVDALKYNTSLNTLDLRYNYIARRGLLALRHVLNSRENMTLTTLELEEEEDEDCAPKMRLPCLARPRSRCSHRTCTCDRCRIKSEIDFFLQLNKTGRHSFSNMDLSTALWSRILAKGKKNPSLIHAALCERPDIAMN